MGKSMVLWACVVFIVAFVGKYLMDMGVFRRIETTGLDKCRLIIPADAGDQAFEDLVIDYTKGIAYMAGDNRSWWHTFNTTTQNQRKQGKVFTFDIQSEKFKKMELINYPYEHFHPLGSNLLKGKTNQLFLTNFRKDNDEIIGTVEVFEIDASNKNRLKWIDSIVHPLFTLPDDVLAIDEKSFYVTNVYHYRQDKVLMHIFETLTKRPWTNVLLCSKRNKWQCSIVADSIAAANGLAASLDFKTIYVAASSEKRVRVYERHPENNALTYIRSLSVPFLVDNILIDDKDRLIAAGHPRALSLLLHEENPRKYRAPSEVVIFPNPKTNSTFETVLLTNGELLSASTVGGTYKNKLLVSGLCDPGILLCQDLF